MLFALFYLSLLSTIFAADLPNIVILFVDGLGWGDIGANGRHTKDLKSVCVTLDGKHLITGSDDNTARLWSLRTNMRKNYYIIISGTTTQCHIRQVYIIKCKHTSTYS